jgi:hypothetical protein
MIIFQKLHTPSGYGLNDDGMLCTRYAIDLTAWCVVDALGGGCQQLAEVDSYHPLNSGRKVFHDTRRTRDTGTNTMRVVCIETADFK